MSQAGANEFSAVSKALCVLDLFGPEMPAAGLSEISRRSGLAKTTSLRVLNSLEAGGYLERVDTLYRLSTRVLERSAGVPGAEPGGLRDVAMPYLSELYQASGWSVNLAKLEGTDVVYLARIHQTETFWLPGGVGQRIPATCTAIGKAILAFSPREVVEHVLRAPLAALTPYSCLSPDLLSVQLATARTKGLAFDRGESATDVICLAAPILRNGTAVAAISISGHAQRQFGRNIDGLLRKAVVATASHLSTRRPTRRVGDF